ncbi:MAG: bifunctional diaminohydroxyphosphoribosylaminopyrimidine deaminase/5-amino-6-(5-phosphoribosylamino)uracil reductase RibD [Candidatus Bathyarchaeota archaeon]|nr:bifunctional diaminohydroxyphosphoribosylaminopyrimidine deaminase/5-amino-6-(5-phosphoribosylamino)uracil reductase RibD [Candidatus Bathyarchaeota archaeon]
MTVSLLASAKFPTKFGNFDLYAFSDKGSEPHLALVRGQLQNKKIPVRIHSQCLTGDVFGSLRCDCRSQLEDSLRILGKESAGMLIYLRQEGRGIGLGSKIQAYSLQDTGLDTVEANNALGFPDDMRDYSVAAEILKFFGVHSVSLFTNNPAKLDGLRANGINVDRVPCQGEKNEINARYLEVKKAKLGHFADDEDFMKLALELAGEANPSPNPKVGAVIVKDGKIIATGYHKKAGMPHAEIDALKKLKNGDAKGATLYVTLEPCSHYGKTPPCTKAIINAGIKRVIAAMQDPNPLVHGLEELRANGVTAEVGLMETEAKELNEAFVKFIETGLPFVTIKAAMSLDGKIACVDGDSKWVTSSATRHKARILRAEYDAILVGINTVLKDNPRLTARTRGHKDPLRVVIDSKLKVPIDAKVFADSNVLVATSEKHDQKKIKILEQMGIHVLIVGKERVDLKVMMQKLAALKITSILIEGGGEVNASALRAGIVDRLLFFVAPKIIGGLDAPGPVGGEGVKKMVKTLKLQNISCRTIGSDLQISAKLRLPSRRSRDNST